MEPNNFEKDFREKLNQRKIEPSSKAWDRLDAMLSVSENIKPTIGVRLQIILRKKWYIAASIIGFLLGVAFFLNQNKTVETSVNKVVVEDKIQNKAVEKKNILPRDTIKKEIAISQSKFIQNSKIATKGDKISNQKLNKTIKNAKNQIAESSIISQENHQTQSVNNQTSTIETSKVEIADQLFNSAEKTTVADNMAKPKSKSKIKINANDLLNQVDDELELSFREKVITKVNKNYQTVKVALANRNQQ